jgi:hypothetical protein
MQKNSSIIILGGMPLDVYGRALGPYRVRTACEKAGYSASIIDATWAMTYAELIEAIDFFIGPDTLAIGISCTWNSENGVNVGNIEPGLLELFKGKYPYLKIVLGVSSTARLSESLTNVADWISGGFAEDSIPELLDYLAGKNQKLKFKNKNINGRTVGFINGNTDYVLRDMDKLETILHEYDGFLPHQPLTIESCRGCIFSCAYCTYPFLGKKNYEYIRSAESMAREFKRNYELFGTTRYMIADDTFNDSLEKIARVKEATQIAKLPSFEFTSYIRPELLHIKPAMIPALIEDILGWKERFITSKNKHFDSWGGGTLIIAKKSIAQQIESNRSIQSDENRSLIEHNPEKYGYKITGAIGTKTTWENKHMTSAQADELSSSFFGSIREHLAIGGWYLSGAWYHGVSNEELSKPKPKYINAHEAGLLGGKKRVHLLMQAIRKQKETI